MPADPEEHPSAAELGPSIIGCLLLFTAEPTDRALTGWHQGDLYIYAFGYVANRIENPEEEP